MCAYACVDNDMYVSVCVCVCVCGGGGNRTAGELKPMRDSANQMSTDHSM